MSIFDYIKRVFFGKHTEDSNTTTTSTQIEVEETNVRRPLKPLYTFYRIGPEYITWWYPVDTTPIDEFKNPASIFKTRPYKRNMNFWNALVGYDNKALQDEDPKLLKMLKEDLTTLATKYRMYGAYTLLGSLSEYYREQFDYFKLAAQYGNKEGMVAYGIFLLTSNQKEKGREWIEKGAELGDEIGMMDMAISYEFGTFTPIDYNKAAYYYRRLINEHNYYYAYINLGVMYVMANYFHTALSLFAQATHLALPDRELYEQIRSYGAKETLENFDSCEQLLTLPIESRIKRAVAQYHAPELDFIFCEDYTSPDTTISANREQSARWMPDDNAEIAEEDIREHEAVASTALVPQKPEVKYPHDDFVFPIYDVQIRDTRIIGDQHELVFLEKNVHSELNQYIQQHLGQLRATFRRKEYLFVYLPTRAQGYEDVISSYFEEDPQRNVQRIVNRNVKTEHYYWKAFFSEEHLPDDCAGFLRFKPNRDNPDDCFNYEYILFPFQPGTNWEKAFSYLVQFVGTLPFVKMHSKKSLPHDTMLLVDESHKLFLIDSTGNKLTEEIKMPILSKALYFTLLHHIDGIAIKALSDYKEELQQWYNVLSNRTDTQSSIETLIDPTNNSVNEKLSRIRKAFETALKNYEDSPEDYIPVGKKTQPYIIHLSRTRILWQPEGMNVFD